MEEGGLDAAGMFEPLSDEHLMSEDARGDAFDVHRRES